MHYLIRKVTIILALAACLAAYSASTLANSCWAETGAHFGIDPNLLKAIAWQESRGHPNAVGPRLKDGNVALGMMQINTIHLRALKSAGIKAKDLMEPCTSVVIGAAILANCIKSEGPTWNAVGCYYTGPRLKSPRLRAEYVSGVMRHYEGYRRQSRME